MSTLGSRLRKSRERKGWTQTFVCRKLGISNSTLSGYERDYREPDADMISTFAELYEISPGWLLTGKEDQIPILDPEDQLSPAEEKLWEEIIKRTQDENEQLFFYKFSKKTAADKRRIMRMIEAMDEADAELD